MTRDQSLEAAVVSPCRLADIAASLRAYFVAYIDRGECRFRRLDHEQGAGVLPPNSTASPPDGFS